MDLGELHTHAAETRRRELELLDLISRVEWKESGYRHLWQFLMDVLRVTQGEAKRLVRRVEVVCPTTGLTGQPIEPQLPAARAAMTEGAVSGEHVTRIVKIIDLVPDEHEAQVDADLTDSARQFTPTGVERIGRRIVDALDPDGPEPVDVTVVEAQNELDLREHEDGSISGRFQLGAETAAHVMPLLSSLSKPQVGDDRTLIERQGDALAEMIRYAADTGKAPMEGGERPHIAVTVSLDTLADRDRDRDPRQRPDLDPGAGSPTRLRGRSHSHRARQSIPADRHRRNETDRRQTTTPRPRDPR